jgi:hypothetical protein
MAWPVGIPPTVAEAEAFVANANARAAGKVWYSLAEDAPGIGAAGARVRADDTTIH